MASKLREFSLYFNLEIAKSSFALPEFAKKLTL